MSWVGVKKLAVVPTFNTQFDPAPPADWSDQVRRRVFYDPDPGTFARWTRLGHLGVEMEAAMMYTIAAVKHIEAVAVMTCSDLLFESGESQRISDADLARGVDDMMRLACHVAVHDAAAEAPGGDRS